MNMACRHNLCGMVPKEEELDITVKAENDCTRVMVSGSVDTEAAEKLRNELARVLTARPKQVVMDLALVPTIGSSGIGKILIFYKELDKIGAKFEIKGIHENLFNIFKSIKLDKLFPISMR